MLTGGVALIVVACLLGEPARLVLARISGISLLAFVYLVTIGSLVGYSAYTYLVGHTSPARLGTYAYVNPVIAVLLAILSVRPRAATR